MQQFSEKIIHWYNHNKRELPWRDTKDAYLIWLSEIILQQTRVEQGRSYYEKFVSSYPTVKHLAKAENEAVMKLWQGLGYYSRARNLHTTAKHIASEHKGKFPNDYLKLLSLKGVGAYTAAAIASFAFDLPHAVVDGNVYRVLSRVFGITTPIDSTAGKKEFNDLANKLLDAKHSALHNQAIMEFGAMQCKPSNPDCRHCPLNTKCCAYMDATVDSLPVKEKKIKVRNRYFNYIVLHNKQTTIIKKRTVGDIWTNLYDFPLIETVKELDEENFLKLNEWKQFIGKNKFVVKSVSSIYKHILSHQRIFARFWQIECKSSIKSLTPKGGIVINQNDIHKYALPRLIDRYLGKEE